MLSSVHLREHNVYLQCVYIKKKKKLVVNLCSSHCTVFCILYYAHYLPMRVLFLFLQVHSNEMLLHNVCTAVSWVLYHETVHVIPLFTVYIFVRSRTTITIIHKPNETRFVQQLYPVKITIVKN